MSIELRRHRDAEAFLAEALAPLERNEAANNLILGVPISVRLHPARVMDDAYYVTLHKNGALAGAAVRTPPHHIVVHVEDSAADAGEALIALLVADALAHAGDLNGANGRVPWSGQFAAAWALSTGGSSRLGTALRAFTLHAVVPPPPTAGALRKAGAADVATVVALSDAFWDETMGHDPGRPDAQAIWRKVAAGEIYLWEDEGAPVCLVARSRPLPHGITLGPVYTPPTARGKGYASNCTAAVSQLLLDEGWDYCTLFTDLENPTSNSIYQRIGYAPVCDYADYHFASGV